MRQLLLNHFEKYPLMQLQDCVKLLYQCHFGCGHFLTDPAQTLLRLQNEYETCRPIAGPLLEPVGPNYCRLYLSALDTSKLSLETLGSLFTYSSQQPVSSKAVFEADLALLGEMIRQREVPFQQSDWEAFLSHYRAKSYPAVSHSDTYRNAYHPAYRVLHKSCWDYWPIFAAIDQIMRQKGCGIVSIDGGSGTGKSHLAKQLAAVFPAAIVHMDDFFLQSFQRTPKRLAEPGGNLDYERFAAQVVPSLKTKAAFSYEIFDCSCGKLSGSRTVKNLPLRIVEGVYSQHPQWRDLYDLNIFLTANPSIRLKRIETRSDSFLLKKFPEEWIPKENLYFDTFSVPFHADLTIDTGSFF